MLAEKTTVWELDYSDPNKTTDFSSVAVIKKVKGKLTIIDSIVGELTAEEIEKIINSYIEKGG